jgi:hypothetical protein
MKLVLNCIVLNTVMKHVPFHYAFHLTLNEKDIFKNASLLSYTNNDETPNHKKNQSTKKKHEYKEQNGRTHV